MRSLPALLTLLWASSAAADPVLRFDHFVRELGPLCATAASTDCYAVAFAHVDADDDGGLTLDELARVQEDLRAWSLARGEELAVEERSGIALGLLVVDTLGLARLFASYDVDANGALTATELGADVVLDDRPLPVLARDPDAVDWAGVQGRLGAMAGIVLPQLGGR